MAVELKRHCVGWHTDPAANPSTSSTGGGKLCPEISFSVMTLGRIWSGAREARTRVIGRRAGRWPSHADTNDSSTARPYLLVGLENVSARQRACQLPSRTPPHTITPAHDHPAHDHPAHDKITRLPGLPPHHPQFPLLRNFPKASHTAGPTVCWDGRGWSTSAQNEVTLACMLSDTICTPFNQALHASTNAVSASDRAGAVTRHARHRVEVGGVRSTPARAHTHQMLAAVPSWRDLRVALRRACAHQPEYLRSGSGAVVNLCVAFRQRTRPQERTHRPRAPLTSSSRRQLDAAGTCRCRGGRSRWLCQRIHPGVSSSRAKCMGASLHRIGSARTTSRCGARRPVSRSRLRVIGRMCDGGDVVNEVNEVMW